MKNIKIIVATHQKYRMPEDSMYLPIHVGAEGNDNIGYKKDNTGENISLKNPYFCELTGLYWAWKNLDAEYIGLTHYRRHFTVSSKIPNNEADKFKIILSQNELEKRLKKADIILPKKREYFIETLYSHYKHTMYVEPLDETRKIIEEKCPKYLKEFDKLRYEAQILAIQGEQQDETKMQKLQELYNFVTKEPKVKEYFDAEVKFNVLLADVNKIIGDAVKDVLK